MISGQLFSLLCDKRPSVYVEVDLYGLPGDSHKKMFKTRTVSSDGLNTIFMDGQSNCKFSLEKVKILISKLNHPVIDHSSRSCIHQIWSL